MCDVTFVILVGWGGGWMIRFFFFKQKTAYEIVSRDWSSDVCSSDLNILDHNVSFFAKFHSPFIEER